MAESTSKPYRPADFGSRFSAFMVDAVLLFAVQWIVVVVLSRQLQAAGMTSREDCSSAADVANGVTRFCEGPNNLLSVLLALFVVGSTIGYHAIFEGRFGATPGKTWMGLAVQSADEEIPIGLGRGVARSVVRQAFWLVAFLLLAAGQSEVSVPAVLFVLLPILALGLLASAAFVKDHRGVHDRAAGTTVVRVRPLVDPEAPEAGFDGPLWSDPDQPEDLPEHLDLDESEDPPREAAHLDSEEPLEREESL